jgi:N-acetylglucosamine-6-phosphate deacetylase
MQSLPRIVKFTNGFLLSDNDLVEGDLLVDSSTGKILQPQSAFYESQLTPDELIDLHGKILSPGFIDVQLNGGFNFDFSVPSSTYAEELRATNRLLVQSGVTSYLPSVTSSRPEVYRAVLPHLGPSGFIRNAEEGAESLGAHVEGPFLSPERNGIHNLDVLIEATSLADIENCYGAENLRSGSMIKKITAAPELGNMTSLIPELRSRNIVFSIGHTDTSLVGGQEAVKAGATMVTHMFNGMRPFGHRDPGIVGLLGQNESTSSSQRSSPASSPISSGTSSPLQSWHPSKQSEAPSSETIRPFFGLIADGIHLHPSSVKIAYQAHPAGAILVTDAMKLAGCPDGAYDWTNGDRIVKKGSFLMLEANDRIAGSAVTMIECVNNFRNFTGCSVAETLACVTSHPAKMLDEDKRKGALEVGMDADLVILDENDDGELVVDQVWKFGRKVHG